MQPAELVGTLAAVPFGVRALALHRSLPDASSGQLRQRSSVSILRDVRWGAAALRDACCR